MSVCGAEKNRHAAAGAVRYRHHLAPFGFLYLFSYTDRPISCCSHRCGTCLGLSLLQSSVNGPPDNLVFICLTGLTSAPVIAFPEWGKLKIYRFSQVEEAVKK